MARRDDLTKKTKDIAAATEAGLFAITPAEPYSAADLNYNDEVSREHKDESLRSSADAGAVASWISKLDI